MSSRTGVTSVIFISSRALMLELWKLGTLERSFLKNMVKIWVSGTFHADF